MSGGGHGQGGKRRVHEEEHEEHENHERWLVSYADMMTLLMVLFIVMFAISQVDTKKFAALKTGLSTGFGAPVALLSGGDELLDVGGSVAPDSVNLPGAAGSTRNTAAQVDAKKVSELAQSQQDASVAKEVKNLKDAEKKLQKALEKAGLKDKATFRFDERGLVVTIATDKVLFGSGSADLTPEGTRILDVVAPTLKNLPNRLSIDGHTNSIPISTAQFTSNWELSSARATGVLRSLRARDGIPYNRMSATGYADTEPLVPGSGPKALSANRRVEIVVLAAIDNSAGRSLAKQGNGETSETTGTTGSSGPLGSGALDSAGASGGEPAGSSNRSNVLKGISDAGKSLSN
jgi:chemotaxis protein MotB